MLALFIILAAIVCLIVGYVTYGSWLAKQWGIDPTKKTPAYEKQDGVDYVPAKPAVLMGHHFSSIAGAGPINGPIQAAVFGWVPVFLWCVVGGFSSAVFRTLVLFLLLSVMTENLLVKSSKIQWVVAQRSFLLSLPCSY